jgi:predicted secreted protein
LNAKLEIANKSTSCVEHVMICNRCKDFNVDACSEHQVSISKLNDEVTSLNAQLKTSKNEFDKLKFARDAYTIGRHPSIKDGLGFKREAKNLTSHKAPIPAKEKGKAPMTNSAKKTMLSCTMIGVVMLMMFIVIGVTMLMIQMPCLPQVLPMCMVEICIRKMSFIICLREMLLIFLGK